MFWYGLHRRGIECLTRRLKGVAMTLMAFVSVLLAALPATDRAENPARNLPLKTVERVDLKRYMGRWYEIARYPNRFQRDCESDTMAEYSLRKDGKVEVVNSCRKRDGTVKTARGSARVVDKSSNARLKVTFFWPFYGDYWIIGLDPEYRYAIVGEPKRKYVWILSRSPLMDDASFAEAMDKVRAAGFEPQKLLRTRHSSGHEETSRRLHRDQDVLDSRQVSAATFVPDTGAR